MKSCLTCGHLIMEPGKPYGYAGPVCHCLVEPKIQRPSDTFHQGKVAGIASIDIAELMKLKFQEFRNERGQVFDRRVVEYEGEAITDTHTPSIGYSSSKYKRKGGGQDA